jgi:dienelactone hydrolase
MLSKRQIVCFLFAACVAVPAPAEEPKQHLHADVHETILRVPVSVTDGFDKQYKADIPVTVFRPDGDGPFPLLILNHGRAPTTALRLKVVRARYEEAGRFFVRKGFVVAMPTRLGNGDQAELGDPEYLPSCAKPNYGGVLKPALQQAEAVIRYMQAQPYVDPERLVVAGQSVGGLMAVALHAMRPHGLKAVINFSGGHGGDPDNHPGEVCQEPQLSKLFATLGRASSSSEVPMLWLYSVNDNFLGERNPPHWYEVYVKAGGTAQFIQNPPFGRDGHTLFAAGNDIWQPTVDEFLRKTGFDKAGVIPRPQPTQFAALTDVSALPYSTRLMQQNYQKFLSLPKPRAFAIGELQRHGFASGDDAISRALAFCARDTGVACRLFAVDDDVVWDK